MNDEANQLTAGAAITCGLACACAIWPDTIGITTARIMMILIGAGSIAGLLWLFDLLPHRERLLPPPVYLHDIQPDNRVSVHAPAAHGGESE